MKKLFFIMFIIGVLGCNNEEIFEPQEEACDNGTYVGNIALFTQQEVDEFGAMCYTKIDGSLTIGSLGDDTNDILDLSSLISLTEIFTSDDAASTASLYLRAYNLPSLNGLQNITKVNRLRIERCETLTDLTGLNGLVEIGDYEICGKVLIWGNSSLTSFDGLENLVRVGNVPSGSSCWGLGGPNYFSFYGNNNLTNVDGLSGLLEVSGPISTYLWNDLGGNTFGGNENLSNLCGLTNLVQNGIYDTINLQLNAYNPSAQDIIDGNCSQ